MQKPSLDSVINALHDAAEDTQHGITGVANAIGVRRQTLINKLNAGDDSHIPNLGDFIMVMMQTGNTSALDEVCAMFNGQFVTRSQEKAPSLVNAVLHLTSETGDVVKAFESAIADNEITEIEKRQILKELPDVKKQIQVIENTLRELSA